ncbi:MAG: hypothetical protein WA542_08375 [Candidatus Acidiferrum sp.]
MKYAWVRLVQGLAIWRMEYHWLAQRESSADFYVCSVAAREKCD